MVSASHFRNLYTKRGFTLPHEVGRLLSDFCEGEVSPESFTSNQDPYLDKCLSSAIFALHGGAERSSAAQSAKPNESIEKFLLKKSEQGSEEKLESLSLRINDIQFDEAKEHMNVPWEGEDWLLALREFAASAAIQAGFEPKNIRNGNASKYVRRAASGNLVATIRFRYGSLRGLPVPSQVASQIEMDLDLRGVHGWVGIVEPDRLMWGMVNYGTVFSPKTSAPPHLGKTKNSDYGKVMPVKFLGVLARIAFFEELVKYLDQPDATADP